MEIFVDILIIVVLLKVITVFGRDELFIINFFGQVYIFE